MKLSKIRSALIILILVLLSGGIGFSQGKKSVLVRISDGKSSSLIEDKSAAANLDLFWEVWHKLERSYLEPSAIDTKKMVYGAIKGMTAALDDPYTSFLPPTDNNRTKEDLSGEFNGIGIQLGFIEKTLAVMSPLPNNPAIKAGIRSRDLILKIKDSEKNIDKDTQGMSLSEAMELIRGKKGTSVTLTVLHEGDKETKEISVIRDTINVVSVELVWKENSVGKKVAWLKVLRFGEKTTSEWEKAVGEVAMKRKSDSRFGGVVLDLRNNPGGFLKGAVDLASEFVADGVIVQQQGKDTTEKFEVDRQGKLIGVPLVILVNQGSASASEILAGALRERLGVKIVGENTFGKGTVQEAQELAGGAGLHVTVARWLLPSGKNIHKEGLKPDIEIKYQAKEGDSEYDNQIDRAVEIL